MENKAPCENCITLSMCKAKLNNGDFFDLMGLTTICSTLKSYLFPSKNPPVRCVVNVTSFDDNGFTAKPKVEKNQHIIQCIEGLKNNLFKGIKFNEWF